MTKRPSAPALPDNTIVGVVGLGDMGAAIATAILRTYPLVACDLRPEAVAKMVALGARSADSLKSVADQCDVAILVVIDDKQVNQVVDELLRYPGKIHTIIVSATVLPSTVIALKAQAEAVGLDLIDAPVSGGAEKALSGTITVMIGGDEAPVKRVWPVLKSFGKNMFHIGPIGAGSAGKLVNNLLSIGGHILQLEAMQLADAYGISEDTVTEFVGVSAGDSRAMRTWGRIDRARAGHTLAGTLANYEFFSKDVKTAALAAGQRSVVLPVAACIGATMVEKVMARDKLLAERGPSAPIPRCSACHQELAYPYRKAGVHPECASDKPGHSTW